jgi:hypothetical protein
MKSLWASVMDNPSLFKKINGWMTIVWIVLIPVSYVMGLLDSVIYVSALSLYAIVTGHMSTWQAARVEVRQEQDERNNDDEFEARLEEKVNQILARLRGDY